jgi:hypothetical protein
VVVKVVIAEDNQAVLVEEIMDLQELHLLLVMVEMVIHLQLVHLKETMVV